MIHHELIKALLSASTEEEVRKPVTCPKCQHSFAFETDDEAGKTDNDDDSNEADELDGADLDDQDDDDESEFGPDALAKRILRAARKAH